MVLSRTNKEEIFEFIHSKLDKYLSSSEVDTKLGIFEKITAEIKSSLDLLTQRVETTITKLESENTKLYKRVNDYE